MTYDRVYLSRASLDELLALAQDCAANDTPAMNEIIRRFEGLAIRLSLAVAAPEHLRDDLANAARMGLVKAARRHNGSPGFPKFAEIYMRGAIHRELGIWMTPEMPCADLSEGAFGATEHDHALEVADSLAPWGGGAVAAAVASLQPSQRDLVDLRYRDDAPIKVIAAITGTSGPAVSQRLGTIQRLLEAALAA